MIGKPMLRTCFAAFVLLQKKKKKTIKIEDGQRLNNKFKNIKLLYVLFEEKEVRCFALWPLWLGATPPYGHES
jgi:hypothetical protein